MVKKVSFAYANSQSYYFGDDRCESCHLILSPNYYYYFREIIPVSSLQKAKKLAPNIVQSRVPDGNYEYYLFKTGEKNVFDIIVFDADSFEEKISNTGIPKEKIKSISFASIEFTEDFAFKEADRVIIKEGNTFLDLPRYSFGESASLKNGINNLLEQKKETLFKISYGKRDTKELLLDMLEDNFKVVASFVVFIGLVVALSGVSYMQGVLVFKDKYEDLGALAKKSSLELEYMKKDLDSAYKKQLELKNSFDRLSEIEGKSDANIKELKITDGGSWSVAFEADSKDSVEKLLASFKKEFKEDRDGVYIYELEL
jgi:hypothetical protein